MVGYLLFQKLLYRGLLECRERRGEKERVQQKQAANIVSLWSWSPSNYNPALDRAGFNRPVTLRTFITAIPSSKACKLTRALGYPLFLPRSFSLDYDSSRSCNTKPTSSRSHVRNKINQNKKKKKTTTKHVQNCNTRSNICWWNSSEKNEVD